jgi:hypothetical protein
MRDKESKVQQKKILILSANPIGTDKLRLDEEVRDIEEGLQRSKYREQFEVSQKWAVRPWDMRRAILDHDPQILHFTGHGEIEGLLVEDKHGLATLIPPRALTGLFKLASEKIECVILNACYSDNQSRTINKYIKYVISMPQEIRDRAAIEFAVGFYDALGAGKPVEEAYEYGCNAVQQYYPELPEQLYPTLQVNDRIRIKKKRRYLPPVLIALFLLAAVIAGLQWNTNSTSKGAVTIEAPSERAVTTDTASPDRDVTSPTPNQGDDILVYITKTGNKYHKKVCTYLRQSKIPISLGDAKVNGYTPCSKCKPPD